MSNLVNTILNNIPLTFAVGAVVVSGIALLYYRTDVFRKIHVLFNQ